MPMIREYNLKSGTPSKNKLVEYRSPTELKKEIDFELGEEPTKVEDLIPYIEKVF